jgi:hypothetical protein
MTVTQEERNRILGMVEEGLVSADEAGQLFDALLEEPVAPPALPVQNRTLRVWVTDTTTRTRQVNMTVNLPLSVLRISLQALASIIPPLRDERLGEILHALESGASGRVMDVQDLEDGKRFEIFIEQ